MSSANALVIGSATTLPASHFLPFFRSLRATGFEGHTCVFAADMEPGERAQLADVVDEIVLVDDRRRDATPTLVIDALRWTRRSKGMRKHFPGLCRSYCRIARVRPGSAVADDLELRLQGLQSLRYAEYLGYLREHPEFDRVMLSDLRDVIFQRDPFASSSSSPMADLEVFLEEPEVTFAAPGFNRRWIEDLYGADGLTRLGASVVSCSGVTFGTRAGMVSYLAAMTQEIRTHLPPLGAHDQAIHNWLLATGRLPGADRVPNGHGRVLTMGAQRRVELADDDATVLNHDGSVPAVLHQYDRHVDLAPVLLAAL